MLVMAAQQRIDVLDGVNAGSLLEGVIGECGYTHREIARLCRISETRFCRAVTGEAALDLWWMRRLPLKVWQAFLVRFTSELIKQYFSDVATPFRMVKVDRRWDGTERRAEKKEQAS